MIFIFLIILFFSLGQLGRISLLSYQINFYFYEILMVIHLLYLIFLYKPSLIFKKNIFKKTKFFYLFFIFLIISFLFNFNNFSFSENVISFLYFLRIIFYFLYSIYFVFLIKKNILLKNNLFYLIEILTGIILLTSYCQYFLYPDLRNLKYLGWDEHLYRMFGLFFDTSITGAVFGLLFLFYLINTKINNKLRLFFLFSIFPAIVLTFSRTTFISIFFVLFLIFLLKRDFKTLIFWFLFFVFILIISPKPFGEGVNLLRKFSIESRLKDYYMAYNVWQKNFLLGIGYNRIGFLPFKNQSLINHAKFSFSSSYLIILVTSGLVGFFIFILSLINLFKVIKRGKELLFFILISSFFDNILLHPFIIFLLLILLTNLNLLFDKKQ